MTVQRVTPSHQLSRETMSRCIKRRDDMLPFAAITSWTTGFVSLLDVARDASLRSALLADR
jgi:hypothetical protein